MVKKRTPVPPTSPGTIVFVIDPEGSEQAGIVIETGSGRYLVRFHDGAERWCGSEAIRSASGRTLYGMTSPSKSEIRRATKSWAPPPRYSHVVEIGDPSKLRPAEEVEASERSEHPTHVDLSPPNEQSVPKREKQRSSGRYSYSRGSEPPPAHDKISVRGLDALQQLAITRDRKS